MIGPRTISVVNGVSVYICQDDLKVELSSPCYLRDMTIAKVPKSSIPKIGVTEQEAQRINKDNFEHMKEFLKDYYLVLEHPIVDLTNDESKVVLGKRKVVVLMLTTDMLMTYTMVSDLDRFLRYHEDSLRILVSFTVSLHDLMRMVIEIGVERVSNMQVLDCITLGTLQFFSLVSRTV